jgi:Tol biopolymer transport system component
LGISVSPDGSRLAFTAGARSEIFVRELSEPEARVVPGTERSISPRFSPDGSVLLFTTQAGEIKSVPVAGGVAQVIVSNVGSNVGSLSSAFWGRDDRVLFGTSEGLMRVSSRGGAPETLVTIASHLQAGEDGLVLLPILLPAGKAVVYHVGKSSGVLDTAVLDLTTGTTKLLPTEVFPVDSSRFVVGAVLDHLLVSTPSGLMAVPFDEERLQVTGPPVIVLPDVFVVPRGFYSNLGISDSGTVAYYSGNLDSLAKYQLVWVDHAGVEQPIPAPVARYTRLRLSPHGDQIATMVIDERDRSNDVWIYQLPDGPLTRRTFDYGNIRTWTPDGRHLVVRLGAGGRTRLASVPADGSGAPVTLIAQTANQPEAMSPDGKVMIGSGGPDQRRVWLWSLGQGVLTGDQHQDYPNSLMDPPSVKGSFRFSPDGKWVAYQSNESGRFEVFVVPYPGPGAKRQVSIDGGTDPRWSRDGRELFYLNGTKMMAAAVETGPTFRVLGTPRMLFDYPGYLETAQYDVSPDGRRFLMARNAPTEPGQQVGQIQVIVNWLEELKTRLAR